jgi:hypothetical protein
MVEESEGEHAALDKPAKTRLPEQCRKLMDTALSYLGTACGMPVLRSYLKGAQNNGDLEAENMVTDDQMSNYAARFKDKQYDEPTPEKYNQLKNACETRSKWPEPDMNAAFIASHQITLDGKIIAIFITTRAALRTVVKRSDLLHADATYKVNDYGWPVCFPTITDYNGHGHPIGMAIMQGESTEDYERMFAAAKAAVEKECGTLWSPRFLVKDGAAAIGNGFRLVFGRNTVLVDCWAHISKNLLNDYKKLPKECVQRMRNDVNLLQTSPSTEVFKQLWRLLKRKWTSFANENPRHAEQVESFLEYFQHHHIDNHSNWHEGVHPDVPSTDNALESLHSRYSAFCTYQLSSRQ